MAKKKASKLAAVNFAVFDLYEALMRTQEYEDCKEDHKNHDIHLLTGFNDTAGLWCETCQDWVVSDRSVSNLKEEIRRG